ncbi:imelysin family protein [Winogradskyella forsetii]|uniref:imelysin family protein n=1 Tax=Winogradskyella forsetii TaxID=2686077 RepID=UPI0015B9217B|nr:imelysin family protein [Winogradskyella forsetii]
MIKKALILLAIVFVAAACSSSDEGSGTTNDNFDRTALLANLADNIIVPALENFQTKLSDLDVARGNFINDINESNLNLLSDAWLEAYKAWQHIEMFNIGEAETQGGSAKGFVVFFNIYPVTVSEIENGAASGVYDLNSANYHDAQGFPALDFLIHGVADNDASPIDKFTTNANAIGYIDYMTNVQSQMNSKFSAIINDWQNTYRDIFVANLASSSTGSFSKIVNDFVFYYEAGLRRNKVGIPAGNFSNMPLPEKVEAFYKKDVSKILALEAMNAVVDFFNGRSFDNSTNGEGFANYLDYLERSELKTAIIDQFNTARQKIEALDNNFYQQVNTDNTKMTEAYDALQMAVVLLKVDMMGAFQVSLDPGYQDNDGD